MGLLASLHHREVNLSHTLNPCSDGLPSLHWPHPRWCPREEEVSHLQPTYPTDVADEVRYREDHVRGGATLPQTIINLVQGEDDGGRNSKGE